LGAEKDQLLGSAAVLLFPPVEPEGHPRVVLEALAASLPVVTTDRGAIRETVVDGVSGFVLDEPEPQLLAQRVLTLLDDDALRAEFGSAARRAYVDRFTQARADRALTDWLLSSSEVMLVIARASREISGRAMLIRRQVVYLAPPTFRSLVWTGRRSSTSVPPSPALALLSSSSPSVFACARTNGLVPTTRSICTGS
jgi:hypothetical protein